MIHNHGRSCLFSGLTLLLSVPWAAPVLAQLPEEAVEVDAGAQTPASDGIEEIVVTAQKRQQALNDVGLTITAVSRDQLDRQGVNSVDDLVKIVPGFHAATTPLGSPVYSLRGVGFYNTTLAATPAVTVYVDEVPLPYPIMSTGAAIDLARVEVLKGPQGTIFGQNSTGGAINYIAAKPTDYFSAGGEISSGTFEPLDFNGHVSGPLAEHWRGRLSVSIQQGEDWQKSYTRDATLGQKNLMIGRLVTDWKPNESATVTLGASGWRDRSDTQAGQYVAYRPLQPALASPELQNYPLSPSGSRYADWGEGQWERDNHFYQVWGRVDYDFGATTLTALSSYAEYDRDETIDSDGISLKIADRLATGHIGALNQEIRIANNEQTGVRWILGATYSGDRTRDNNLSDYQDGTSARATNPGTESIYFYSKQKFESYGLFANAEVDLGESVTLKVGGRYTDTRRDFEGCSKDPGDGLTATAFGALWSRLKGSEVVIPAGGCITLVDTASYTPGVVRSELNEDNFSWRVGADWHVSPSGLLYLNISKGYKAGAYPTASATTEAQYDPVTQESVLAYEAGIKADFLDRALSLTGAVFYYDYDDKQVLGRIPVPVFRSLDALVSIPKSSVFGQEVTLDIRPLKGLNVSLSAAHLDAEIDRYVGYNDLGAVEDFSKTKMPFSCEWEFSGSADYEWALSSTLLGFVGGNLRYQGATNAYPGSEPVFDIDSYRTLDLRAGIAGSNSNWRLTFWGRNVTDEDYYNNVQRQVDTVVRFMARPATFGATLSVSI